jgi:hypothetical protein
MWQLYLAIDSTRVITMYILGLQSSWGIHPSWSPSGHVLTPALSPFLGARVRSHACLEEVVYSLNDSCSYFTQHLFPLSVSYQHTVNISLKYTTKAHIHIIYHIYTYIRILVLYITLIRTFISSFLLLFVAGWLPSNLCVGYIKVRERLIFKAGVLARRSSLRKNCSGKSCDIDLLRK